MSLAATLAASGMRPASFLPTIKCSHCDEDIEISAMSNHECSSSSPSPNAASASANNPAALRQTNASETNPVQPSPLQFRSDTQTGRPRAPTAGSNQSRPPRPDLPRINSAAANQPFLVASNPTPTSPASSTRSGSSISSKGGLKPRSATNTSPRIFDPRPPSPELSENMDSAFPPFPPTPVTSSRKGSTASRSSRKDSIKSPVESAGDYPTRRTSSRRSGATDRSSNSPGKEDRLGQETQGAGRLPSPQVETLTPVEEHPLPPMSPVSSQPRSANSSQPLTPISPQPRGGSSLQPLNGSSLPPQSANSLWPPSASSIGFDSILPPASISSEPELDGRSGEGKGPSKKDGLRSISGTIRQALSRRSSEKRTARNRAAKSDEAQLAMSWPRGPVIEHQPTQKRIPPPRPARPEEGLPAELLHPLSMKIGLQRAPLPPPVLLEDVDRSRTEPVLPLRTGEDSSPTKLSKVASEPALRSKAGSINSAQVESFASQERSMDGSRVDHRMQNAPPVPKAVQAHRIDSLHKSSDSGASTTSSRSLSNLSQGNSNTTSGTSPPVSVTNSVDVFLPAAHERNSGDDGMHVAALAIKPQQGPEIRAEQLKRYSATQMDPDHTAAEVLPSVHESASQHPSTLSDSGHWPLESPMDPALQDGKLSPETLSQSISPVGGEVNQLSSDSYKTDYLSSDVYEPKRSLPSIRTSAQASQNENGPKPSAQSDFQGFNFETSPISPDEESTRTPSPNEDEMKAVAPSPLNLKRSASEETEEHLPQPQQLPTSVPQKNFRPLARQPTSAGRAVCRGCGERIEGKSMKAADGGLTGRWHKACFVCQSCRAPFETADFYVINNLPYCEQHYHEKNGSVCYSCHRGIEGEFLETTSGPGGRIVRKYHRRCFTCFDCRMVLSEDYFEIAGRVHCERHALAAMRSQTRRPPPGAMGIPGSRLRGESIRAERQRTKIMPR